MTDPNIEARKAARARGLGPKPEDVRLVATCFLLRAIEGLEVVIDEDEDEDEIDIRGLGIESLRILGVTEDELLQACRRLDSAKAAEQAAG